jgi:predicted SAM-dependent methyltransferase
MSTNDSEKTNAPENKFTISEKGGLSYLRETDLAVYSPGISTAGGVEIEMARRNPNRILIGTTIDSKGFGKTAETVKELGLDNQVYVKFEDLREQNPYEEASFDFIYARLVLHYLTAQDLDFVLNDFHRVLKINGRLFIVVRSEKNISEDAQTSFDPETKLTTIEHPGGYPEIRYFHTPESIAQHLQRAGFSIEEISEYEEKLYLDFERKVESSYITDHLIEIRAFKE